MLFYMFLKNMFVFALKLYVKVTNDERVSKEDQNVSLKKQHVQLSFLLIKKIIILKFLQHYYFLDGLFLLILKDKLTSG